MLVVGMVFAGLAAALHVVIFWMESLAWDGPAARRVFGPATAAEVESTRVLAFNQGFYNLFLAVVTAVGIGFVIASGPGVGPALVLAGTGSMAAAATVLFLSNPGKRSAALRQGTLPLLAVIATLVGL